MGGGEEALASDEEAGVFKTGARLRAVPTVEKEEALLVLCTMWANRRGKNAMPLTPKISTAKKTSAKSDSFELGRKLSKSPVLALKIEEAGDANATLDMFNIILTIPIRRHGFSIVQQF